MIDRQHGSIVIECDSGTDDFAEAWSAAKREVQPSRKIANEWLHGCQKCGVPT